MTPQFVGKVGTWDPGEFMNRLLIVAILIIEHLPLYAQGQQPNIAQLKADAQKVVGIISGDKAKTQTYCQIANLGDQIDQANQEKDSKKAEDLSQKINELEKNLAPNTSRWSMTLEPGPQFQGRSGDRVDIREARTILSALTAIVRPLTPLPKLQAVARPVANKRNALTPIVGARLTLLVVAGFDIRHGNDRRCSRILTKIPSYGSRR